MRTIPTAFLLGALALTASLGTSAFADRRTVPLSKADFDSVDSRQIDPSVLLHSQTVVKFADWVAKSPKESAVLVLYPGYVEPTVTTQKDGTQEKSVEKLMIFVESMKTALNKPPGQIDLKKMIDLETVGKFDPEIKHIAIQPAQLMSNVVGKGPINNFAWCNTDGPNITRPSREIDLASTVSPSRPWCQDNSRSLCIESCYLFNPFWHEGVNAVNLGMDADSQKDLGIASQSEIRYFLDEKELGLSVPLQELTKIKTPVRGGFEQSLFYFNQVMQFGKIISVLQDSPVNPNQTIMTTFFVIAVKQRTYNSFGMVKDILAGESGAFNSPTGLTAGLPVYSQNTIKGIAAELEK